MSALNDINCCTATQAERLRRLLEEERRLLEEERTETTRLRERLLALDEARPLVE